MQEVLKYQWLSLWEELQASSHPLAAFSQLVAHYTEPHRAYHNLKHIDHCLRELDEVRALSSNAALIELAIWFHDVIYDPRSKENEEQSAQIASNVLTAAKLDGMIKPLCNLILATKHNRHATDPDQQILIDIDLSILGQPSPAFSEYEKSIRQEYSWVPENDFRTARAKILRSFLDRTTIFSTATFQKKYESTARKNLENSIAALGR